MTEKERTAPCARCGKAGGTFDWDNDAAYCSEACFEADKEDGDGD